MKEHYNILLATDYSEAVMNAERYAVQFALNTAANLTLLNVYDEPFVSLFGETDVAGQLLKYKKNQLKKLKTHRDELFKTLKIKKQDLNCDCIVKSGIAGTQILSEAKKIYYDFIIVGTHGASGFRETFFGTHAWSVIKNAQIPVLAIPQDALFKGIKKMVFATEFREGEIPIIQFLSHLSKQYNAELTILNVINYSVSKSFEKQLTNEFLNEVKSQTNNSALSIQIIKNENLTEGLNNYCISNQVDWLIMSPEKKFLFEKIFKPGSSSVKKMTFQTQIPLFIVPDFYNPKFAKFLDIIDVNTYMSEEF
ncbi:MAG: hypothetical protein A3F72_05240 [Bacteroidetes bacterium RIFCSPLOWO2_12_FULL_35_15]|nr:MAG: hypothetical protein A3F72_05240 [Bacteroidetes bacterium RIFCSPLOWO2_12_FULL_35_15]